MVLKRVKTRVEVCPCFTPCEVCIVCVKQPLLTKIDIHQ